MPFSSDKPGKSCGSFHSNHPKEYTSSSSGKNEFGISNYDSKPYTSTWSNSSGTHTHSGRSSGTSCTVTSITTWDKEKK